MLSSNMLYTENLVFLGKQREENLKAPEKVNTKIWKVRIQREDEENPLLNFHQWGSVKL